MYVGVTRDLVRRMFEHREADVPGFTPRCEVKRLVHLEAHEDGRDALQRQKNLSAALGDLAGALDRLEGRRAQPEDR